MIFNCEKADVSFIKLVLLMLICSIFSTVLFFFCGLTVLGLLLKDIGTGTIISPPISIPFTRDQLVSFWLSLFGFGVSVIIFPLLAFFARRWIRNFAEQKKTRIWITLGIICFPIILVFCASMTLLQFFDHEKKVTTEMVQETTRQLKEKNVEVKLLDVRAVEFDDKYNSLTLEVTLQIRNIPPNVLNYEFQVVSTTQNSPLNFADFITSPNGGKVIATFENDGWKFREDYRDVLLSENSEKMVCRFHHSYNKKGEKKIPRYLTIKLTLNVRDSYVETENLVFPTHIQTN